MNAETLSEQEVLDTGLDALRERLGVVGTVRFLQQLGGGYDDYTDERHRWLDNVSREDILAGIRPLQHSGPPHNP